MLEDLGMSVETTVVADTLHEARGSAGGFDVHVRITAGYGLDVRVTHVATGRTVAHVSRGASLPTLRAGLAAKSFDSPEVAALVLRLVDEGLARLEPD